MKEHKKEMDAQREVGVTEYHRKVAERIADVVFRRLRDYYLQGWYSATHDEIAAILAESWPEQKWIPVSENHPSEGLFVLVITKRKNYFNAAWVTNADDETRWVLAGGGWIDAERVTHWQPLPAAPEREP